MKRIKEHQREMRNHHKHLQHTSPFPRNCVRGSSLSVVEPARCVGPADLQRKAESTALRAPLATHVSTAMACGGQPHRPPGGRWQPPFPRSSRRGMEVRDTARCFPALPQLMCIGNRSRLWVLLVDLFRERPVSAHRTPVTRHDRRPMGAL